MASEERRYKLRKYLEGIIGNANEIDKIMADVSHPNGIAHRSLKPRCGEYVVHVKGERKAVTVGFRARDGKYYQINITEESEK